jgi:hypothetical protein
VCFIVLHSSQNYLKTGTRDLDHSISCWCKKTPTLGVKIGIGAPDDCKDYAMSWEGFALLLGLLDLWWRWRRWVGFSFDLGVIVILRWIGDLRNC